MVVIHQVSIHAPVEGATTRPVCGPHPGLVSIHAPVEGATPSKARGLHRSRRFDPRPRGGGDLHAALRHAP